VDGGHYEAAPQDSSSWEQAASPGYVDGGPFEAEPEDAASWGQTPRAGQASSYNPAPASAWEPAAQPAQDALDDLQIDDGPAPAAAEDRSLDFNASEDIDITDEPELPADMAGDFAPSGESEEPELEIELTAADEVRDEEASAAAQSDLDVDVDVDMNMDFQSGTLADFANNEAPPQPIELELDGDPEAAVPLASNIDFIDNPALTSTGESWSQRSDWDDAPVVENTWSAEPEMPAWQPQTESWPLASDDASLAATTQTPMFHASPASAEVRAGEAASWASAAQPLGQLDPGSMRTDPGLPSALFGSAGGGGLQQLPPAPLSARAWVGGEHRVIVHTVEGLVKRGTLRDADLLDEAIILETRPGIPPEQLPLPRLKAVFFMLPPGTHPPAVSGRKLRVTFSDGRQVSGFSNDYSDAEAGFFLVPADNRTNTDRIFIYRGSVQSVVEG
jgi:cell division septation protein DedD